MPIRWGSTRRLLPGVAVGDTAAVAQKLPRILSTHVAKAERLCTLPAASRATRSSHPDLNVSVFWTRSIIAAPALSLLAPSLRNDRNLVAGSN